MCVVIDACCFSGVFNKRNSKRDEFLPIYDWLYKGKGMMVYGGTKYRKEMKKASSYRKIFIELLNTRKMKLIDNNIANISDDIHIIKTELSNVITRIGLFGSSLTKPIHQTNDIDLVVYSKTSLEDTKKRLLNLTLNSPICPHKMNGTYGIKENDVRGRHYHIVILDSKYPNKEFESINNGKIHFL